MALVGIDIRMVTLVDQVKNVRIYDSGYAPVVFLTLESCTITPTMQKGPRSPP